VQSAPAFLGWVEDEFVVVFGASARPALKPGSIAPAVGLPSIQALLRLHGVERLERQFPTARAQAPGSGYPDLTGHYKVELPAGADLEAAVVAFASDPNVERVEKIGIHTLSATPNDPYYEDSPNPQFPFDQWHLWDNFGIDADLAWDIETGSTDVVVAILDSGVRYFHVDLGGGSAGLWGPDNPASSGNIWVNAGEIPDDQTDNDMNGFVDDTIGYDFVSSAGGPGVTCLDNDCSVIDNDPDDFNGHGTHVAGTVGALTNNALIGAGIAGGFSNGSSSGSGNGIKILPLRIGYHALLLPFTITGVVRMDWAAQAMNYVADLVDAGVNVTAVNCSWGSSNSGGIDAAVNALLARDVMVVHAAGNNNSSTPDYLGGKAGVMNVAATDTLGAGADFTNHGFADVAAPGTDVVSTYRSPDDPDPTHHYIAASSGTSMSAPHICGIAALLESCDPSLSGADKFTLIVDNTTPYTDARDLGSGIANARLALEAACAVPCDIVASFSASPQSGCDTLTVSFTDLSSGTSIDAWAWDFGDGATSTVQNPTHLYAAPGTYDVTLIASSAACADTAVSTALVSIDASPTAAFGATPTTGPVPLLVAFADSTLGSPVAWEWDFGDGNTTFDQNPTHTYATDGTYTVQLIATNACGADTLIQPDLVVASPAPCDIVAGFSAAPDSGCASLSVSFTDLSTGAGVDTWGWDFGDGNTSTEQHPSHDYSSEGRYDVMLVATSGACSDTMFSPALITVGMSPISAFSAAPTTGAADLDVAFTDESTGNPSAWAWDFGDANSSTEQNPTHTYTAEGTYTVTLVTTNSCGVDTLVAADAVTVDPNPTDALAGPIARGARTWVSPNPFGLNTQIFFRLDKETPIEIVIYDVTGRPVRHLAARRFAPGTHIVPFDGATDRGVRLASGMYFYRFAAGERVETHKLIVSR
jgi:PKD repeat protein